MIDFDKALGIHAQALLLRAQRTEVLAANLANADTPRYLARDMDFQALLDKSQRHLELSRTHEAHLSPAADSGLLYRIPLEPAIDGNTVDPQVEKAAFLENAMRYQATLSFLDGRIKGLLSAIRGE
ncbi:MAG: flagellar basal body rod protein FlgB [Gammaproteobacteria bacterium]|nr:MAG: flagellar basal body rod protein FlgB [Gammaproteobacteria bacterium]